MRFLVDLYRYVLIGLLAIALIAGTYFTILALGQTSSPLLGGMTIAAAIGSAIGLILAIGLTATIVSIHDRLSDISDSLATIAARSKPRAEPVEGGEA